MVPPHVMEKWFDLADVMPAPNPLNAADSGKSLAGTYRQIIYNMKILGLKAKSESRKGEYAQALGRMNEMVTDPENVTAKVPLLAQVQQT